MDSLSASGVGFGVGGNKNKNKSSNNNNNNRDIQKVYYLQNHQISHHNQYNDDNNVDDIVNDNNDGDDINIIYPDETHYRYNNNNNNNCNNNNSPPGVNNNKTLPFPHFPPPPSYPPPQKYNDKTKGKVYTYPNNNDNKNSIKKSSNVKVDDLDLDAIEVYVDPNVSTKKNYFYGSGAAMTNGKKNGISTIVGQDIDDIQICNSSFAIKHNEPQNNSNRKIKQYEQQPSTSKDSRNPYQYQYANGNNQLTNVYNQQNNAIHSDYAYTYHEINGGEKCNRPSTSSTLSLNNNNSTQEPPPNSMRALLSLTKRNVNHNSNTSLLLNSNYGPRYGTHENIYEEIGSDERLRINTNPSGRAMTNGQSMISLNQSMVEEEFRRVQNGHRRILGELNLSVEAMLMPTTPPSDSPTERDDEIISKNNSQTMSELLTCVEPTDELLSPVSAHASNNGTNNGDLDSGFSGSSSGGASYMGSLRCRTGSILSTFQTRSSTPSCPNTICHNGSCRSSQRSHEDPGILSLSSRSSSSYDSGKPLKSAEDPGPTLRVTSSHSDSDSKGKSTVKTSFWNRKAWRKIPGFSSTSSVNKTGLINTTVRTTTIGTTISLSGKDENKYNTGAWEDPLPITTKVSSPPQLQHHCNNNINNNNNNGKNNSRSDPLTSPYSSGINNNNTTTANNNNIQPNKNCSHNLHTDSQKINNKNYLTSHQQQPQQQEQPHPQHPHYINCKRLENTTTSARTISSEDSWCSEKVEEPSENELSSEGEDESDRSSVTSSTNFRNSQIRSTLNKAKQHLSLDKWRGSIGGIGSNNNNNNNNNSSSGGQQQSTNIGIGTNNSTTMATTQQESTSPGESPGIGRLSRWFSMRRSSHQYDVGGGGGVGGRDSRTNSFDLEDKQPLPPQQQLSPKTNINNNNNTSNNNNLSNNNSNSNKMPQLTETDEVDPGSGIINQQTARIGSQNHDKTLFGSAASQGLNNSSGGGRGVGVGGVGGNIGVGVNYNRQITPTLPSAPAGLSQQQLKRRHIIAAIVHSENSYVATLQRLVNDYKKPLEESNPPILSCTKLSTLFHRLPEILQCHTLFRISLAECVRNWDREENLGDLFVNTFGKPIVLDIYSGFINNFSSAMELAKMEAKRKSALADFFKVKQISAHDRLSFFGLMVRPVQRFPQFILFLQDLLKYTPHDHHDRMALQLALTQLESLTEMLNERKREAEQYQAFKEMLGHISGTFNTRSLSSDGNRQRYLLREDNVTQMEFNQSGFITKSKQRRLLLLNDKIVCVSVAPKQSHDFGATEKLTFKWMYPVGDVEIVDTSTSATLSRILTAGLNRGGSLKSNSSGGGGGVGAANTSNETSTHSSLTNGADNLCNEMSNLMHDYEIMSRINDLTGQLKGYHKDLNSDIVKRTLSSIQCSIQKKDEEMAWVDSCCLQMIAKTKNGKEETYTFQTENPSVKKEWITELRLAQLALDVNNSPAWELPEREANRPTARMPLFVKTQSVYKSQHQTEVRCGCYYTTTNHNRTSTRRRPRNQNYLWICTIDGTSSHITILLQHQQRSGELKDVNSFDLVETLVTSMEFVKGLPNIPLDSMQTNHMNGESNAIPTNMENDPKRLLEGDTIWMGTDTRKLLIYSATNPEQEKQLTTLTLSSITTQILYTLDNVFVSLSNGIINIYRRGSDGQWLLKEPQIIAFQSLPLINSSNNNNNNNNNSTASATDTISNLLSINANIYAGYGRKIYVLNGFSGNLQKTYDIQQQEQLPPYQQNRNHNINLMAHSGIGLWISMKHSSIIHLYHTETFKHLQDINIATSVLRLTSSQRDTNTINNHNSSVHVTALMACRGLLWVGTNVGITLTIPLPRLEGVPIISGGVNISYHAHFGPITFLLPLIQRNHNKISTELLEQQHQQYQHQLQQQQINNQYRLMEENIKEHIAESDVKLKNNEPSEDNNNNNNNNSNNKQTTPKSSTEHHQQQLQNKRKLEKQNSLDITTKLRAQIINSPIMIRRRRIKEIINSSDTSSSSTSSAAARLSKTLPRGLGGSNALFSTSSIHSNTSSSQSSEHSGCDVYGLYGGLIYVKENFESEEGQGGNLMEPSYECLRRSDPELAAIPAKVSTLDRRLKMKVSRPRSLDLSNWSVDSRSSSLYTSSGSEESMGILRHGSGCTGIAGIYAGRSVSRNSSSASHKTQTNGSDLTNICENGTTSIVSVADVHTPPTNNDIMITSKQQPLVQDQHNLQTLVSSTMKKKKTNKNNNNNNNNNNNDGMAACRTVIMVMGGRGYINWKQICCNSGEKSSRSSITSLSSTSTFSHIPRHPNSNDAHIVIWEKKS